MKFAVGLWDYLWGDKVTIEIAGPDNELIKRKVTKRWFEVMQREGKMRELENVVRVHMLHVLNGYNIQNWVIGQDIDAETVEKFRDSESDDIYAMTHYKDGEEQTQMLARNLWEKARREMDAA